MEENESGLGLGTQLGRVRVSGREGGWRLRRAARDARARALAYPSRTILPRVKPGERERGVTSSAFGAQRAVRRYLPNSEHPVVTSAEGG